MRSDHRHFETRRQNEVITVTLSPPSPFTFILYDSQSLPIRQFLLTNLVQRSKDEPFVFRLPLDILLESISDIGDFPFTEADGVTFDKPTLFVKGADSKYINRKNIPVAQNLFPNSRVEIIEGAGHWGE